MTCVPDRLLAAHGRECAVVGEDRRVGDLFGEVEEKEDVGERVVFAPSSRAEERDGERGVDAGEVPDEAERLAEVVRVLFGDGDETRAERGAVGGEAGLGGVELGLRDAAGVG